MNNYVLQFDSENSTWNYRGVQLESDVEKQNLFFLLPLLENGRENLENEFPNFPFTKSIGKFALNSGSSYWIDLGTDWLNEEEFDDSVEKNILEINSQKLYTQQLRHKLLKQLSYWRRHK